MLESEIMFKIKLLMGEKKKNIFNGVFSEGKPPTVPSAPCFPPQHLSWGEPNLRVSSMQKSI